MEHRDFGQQLIEAVKAGAESIVKKLIAAGADVNVVDTDEETPLTWSLWKRYPGITTILIDAGADVNITNKRGWSTLHQAAQNADWALVELLVRFHANINAVNNLGITPLNRAVYSGEADLVRFFVEHGADTNIADNKGETPLHLAAYNGWLPIIQILIEAGADINAVDRTGSNIVHCICDSFFIPTTENVAALIPTLNINLDIKNNIGQTPLHILALHAQMDLMKVFIKMGADPFIEDSQSMTSLEVLKKTIKKMSGHIYNEELEEVLALGLMHKKLKEEDVKKNITTNFEFDI